MFPDQHGSERSQSAHLKSQIEMTSHHGFHSLSIQSPSIDRECLFVCADTSVSEVITRMSQERASCVLVLEEQRLIGIVTERDIVKITADLITLENVPIHHLMTANPVTIPLSQDLDLFEVLSRLRHHQIRHLPVVDEFGQVVGVINQNNLREVLKPLDLLKLKSVSQVMTAHVIHVEPTASLIEITQQMASHRISCVVIVETTNTGDLIPVGIITERDIVQFQALRLDLSSTQGQQVMSTPLLPIGVEDSLWHAHQLMEQYRIRRLVVIHENGTLAGILTQSSLLEALDPTEMYSTLETLRQQVDQRIVQLNQTNQRLQQEITLREQELCDRRTLEQQLQEQNARLQAEIRERIRAEAALAKREQELRALVENAPDMIWRQDRQFRYLYANPAAQQIAPIAAREMIGKTNQELGFPEDYVVRWQQALEQVFTTGVEARIEYQMSLKPGVQYFSARVVPEFNQGNEIDSVLVVARDITERKLAEEELRSLNLTQENALEGISRLDQHGRYLSVNSAYTRKVGYEPEEMIGMEWSRTVHPDDQERLMAAYQEMLETGKVEVEARGVRKDGSIFYKQVMLVSAFDQQNRFIGHYCFMKDISERQATLQERQRREEALRLIMEGTASTVGENFFYSCTRYLAKVVDVRYALIAELVSSTSANARTLAFWAGEEHGDNFEYELAGTPCENVSRGLTCIYDQEIQSQFPDDPYLVPLGVESYIGIPLQDAEGNVIGLLAVLDTKPLQPHVDILMILQIFAARAGAELEQKKAQKKLQQQTAAMAAATDGIAILNPQGEYGYLNAAFLRIFGYEQEAELLGKSWESLYVEGEVKRLQEEATPVLLKQGYCRLEAIGLRRDGSPFPQEVSITLLENGERICIVRDITARKHAQEALKASEERLQLALEGSDLGLWDWNWQTGETYFSPRWKTMLGYEDAELENNYQTWETLVHPEDLPRALEILKASLEERIPRYQVEFRMRSKSAGWLWILAQGKIVERDSQGKPLRMAGTHKDITEQQVALQKRQQAELALQQQLKREQLLSLIQERIRASLKLEEVLKTAAEEVRQFLATDRVLIYRIGANGTGCVVTESVALGCLEIAGQTFPEAVFAPESQQQYSQGQIVAIEDVAQAAVSPDRVDFVRQFGVKAQLVVPILTDADLWGLLIVQDCQQTRQWHTAEIESLRQIAVQLAIAVQQSILFEHAQAEIVERKKAEAALRESQRFVQQIADTSPNLLYIYDMIEQHNIYANREIAEVLGYTSEEIRAMGAALLPTIMHPDDLQKVPAHFQRFNTALEGEILELEYRMRNAQGEWRYLLGRESLFARAGDGTAKQLIGTATDITELKRTETELRDSAEREQALAAAIQRIRQSLDLDTIFVATTEELRQVIDCERVAIYRFNPDWSGEFVAESVASYLVPLLHTPNLQTPTILALDQPEQCRIQTLLNSPNQWQDAHIAKTLDRNSNLETLCLVVEDIHTAGFSQCYRERLEQFQVRAYIIVPIFCNFKIWGLLAVYQCSSPRPWKTTEKNIVMQISNQLGVALQQSELLKQTQQQSVALQKAVVAADAANQAKSEFLASMSHELRTPLNAILGFSQVMAGDSSLKAEQQHYLSIINRAGEHLLSLINDILEMSKIEAGRTTLNPNDFDLFHLLDNLENMLRSQAESKGLQLIFETAPDVPNPIKTDEGKLRQVLLNILGNAIKFTQQGRVILRVRRLSSSSQLKKRELLTLNSQQLTLNSQPSTVNRQQSTVNSQPSTKPSTLICFEIEDTGPGIAPEEMELLFEAFAQTETGRKSQQGTGLGLSISQKFVQLMGGEIRVTSQLNQGTVFAFEIEVEISDLTDAQVPQYSRKVIALAPDQPESRILVVDDRPESRLLLRALLTTIGFKVEEGENGQEAIAIWLRWQPQLILMDMRMPGMNGYEATQRIKNTLQGQATVIIALTASVFEKDRKMVLDCGCDDFVRKPFQVAELLEKISQHLGIQYIYEEESSASSDRQTVQEDSLTVDQLTADCFQVMPPEWIAQVHHAALQCSDDLILELLQQIPSEYTGVATALADLANNFQFDRIETLTEPEAQ